LRPGGSGAQLTIALTKKAQKNKRTQAANARAGSGSRWIIHFRRQRGSDRGYIVVGSTLRIRIQQDDAQSDGHLDLVIARIRGDG